MMPLQILSPDVPKIISSPYKTIQTLDLDGNMGNISKTFLIDISIMTRIMANIQIGANRNHEEIVSFTCHFKDFYDVFPWSDEEMHGIDPFIVKHEIKEDRAFFLWYFSYSLIRKILESPSSGSLNYHEEDRAFFLWYFSCSLI